MEVINKHIDAISTELSSSQKNMDKVIDMFKTTAELYAHTQSNLVNTILYPESTMSVKYPSDWYRPTATFRLTQTYTFQPVMGKFFAIFYPNLLYTESSIGSSSLKLFTAFENSQTSSAALQVLKDIKGGDLGSKITNALMEKGEEWVKDKLKGIDLGFLKKFDKNYLSPEMQEKVIEDYLKIPHDASDNIVLNTPDNIIDQYRCNAAVLKIKGEDSQGVLMGTTTYFNTSTPALIQEQVDRYKTNFSNFAQEWLYKLEENPENGMRIIKTPKDNSDIQFRYPNSNMNSEQVIMIAGKGLNPNSVYLIDVIQHIEFIPKIKMMDFFTPTIPMFSLGSKEQLFKSTSNFPIIGANGSLIINSPAKVDKIMEIIKKYRSSGYNLNLWNILTDSSFINDENLLSLVSSTFYK